MSETVEISRDEFEALKERVRQLERELETQDATHPSNKRTDLDHRDKAVIKTLNEGEKYHGRTLVRRYRNQTDIVDSKTAKKRAKRLHKKDCFEGRTYVGY